MSMNAESRKVILEHAIVAVVLFLIQRAVATFCPYSAGQYAVRTVIKGFVTASITVLCLRTGRVRKEKPVGLLFAGLICCVAGDVLLNYFFVPGMAVFAGGHICFCVAFGEKKKPDTKKILIWAGFSAAVAVIAVLLRGTLGSLTVPVILYGAVLIAMLVLSTGYNGCMVTGAAMFMLSDLMTGIEQVMAVNGVFEFILLALYYAGVLLMAEAPWMESRTAAAA